MMTSCVEEGVPLVMAKGPFGEIIDVSYSIGLICPGVGVGVVGRVDDPHRPILTGLVLVPGVVPSVPSTSSASSSARGPSTAVSVRRQARRPFRSSSDRLFSLQCRLGAGGVSRDVALLASRMVRPSTSRLYRLNWWKFRGWCRARDVSASSPSVYDVARFFAHLRDNLRISLPAIEGFRSAISSVLPFVGSHPVLSDVLRGFALSIPRASRTVVSWRLDVVLRYLGVLSLCHLAVYLYDRWLLTTSLRASTSLE